MLSFCEVYYYPILPLCAAFVTLATRRSACDVICDVQAQSGSAKSNKISGDAFSFRAGGFSFLAFIFSGLVVPSRRFPEKLIIPWLGVQIPPGPPLNQLLARVSFFSFWLCDLDCEVPARGPISGSRARDAR